VCWGRRILSETPRRSDGKSQDTVSSRDSIFTVLVLVLRGTALALVSNVVSWSCRDIYLDSCDLIVRSKNFVPSYVILSV